MLDPQKILKALLVEKVPQVPYKKSLAVPQQTRAVGNGDASLPTVLVADVHAPKPESFRNIATHGAFSVQNHVQV